MVRNDVELARETFTKDVKVAEKPNAILSRNNFGTSAQMSKNGANQQVKTCCRQSPTTISNPPSA